MSNKLRGLHSPNAEYPLGVLGGVGKGDLRKMRIFGRGASRYDVGKFFGYFDPLPPCPHLDLICSIKFTYPPLLRLLFHNPPPPMQTSYMWKLLSAESVHAFAV